VLLAVHAAAAVHIAHWKLTGRSVSPVEPSEAMETLELGYVNAGFVLFVVAILATLLLGRFFCGWACHLVAYQDFCAWGLGKLGLRPRPIRSQLLLWAPLLLAGYMFVWPTAKRLWVGDPAPTWQNRLLVDDLWATFPGPWMSAATLIVCGFLIVYWLGSKGFCSYGCPYGGVFGVVDRLAPVRIRVTDACEGCGHCTATCTSNVQVHSEVARYGMVVDPGCMKCMDCVSVCPKDALFLGAGRPALLAKPLAGKAAQPATRRPDFTRGEELALAATCLGGFLAFYGLYSYVPLLLAVGLGVLTATAALTAWRLLRSPEFAFQNRVLRRGGALTGRGWLVAALCLAWLALTAHSGWVHYWSSTGRAQLAALAEARRDQRPVDPQALAHAQASLGRAHAAGVFGDPQLEWALAQTTKALARAEASTDSSRESAPGERQSLQAQSLRHLRAAVQLEPAWQEPALELSDRLLAARDIDGTEAVLDRLLRATHSPPAAARRAFVRALRASQRRDLPATLEALRDALDADPGFEPARRQLDALQRR